MKHTICYTSKAVEGLKNEDINEIFNTTVHNNTEKAIRGILLQGMGNFLQVLEGDKEVIEQLYMDIILKDTRHHQIFEIINKEATDYIFSEYSTTFEVIDSAAELEKVRKYLNRYEHDTRADKIARLLKPFILLE